MKKQFFMVFLLMMMAISIKAQEKYFLKFTGPYLGQKPPGKMPEIFAPEFVSTGLDELNSIFSPDGRELYFCVRNFSGAVSIFQMKMMKKKWSQPKLLPFSSRYGDIDVTMSPDGGKILFSSKRPILGSDKPKEDYYFGWSNERVIPGERPFI